MYVNNRDNLPHFLNYTNYDWDFEMWHQAAYPADLGLEFFVATGIWFAINVLVGSLTNGAVLVAFFRDKKVRSNFLRNMRNYRVR